MDFENRIGIQRFILNAQQNKGQAPVIRNDLSNIAQVRQYMEWVKSVNGYMIDLPTGLSEFTQVNLPGTAKVMLGLKFLPLVQDGDVRNDIIFSLNLNNENVIRESNLLFYTASTPNNVLAAEYNSLIRPLSGTDNFVLNFNNPATAGKLYMNIYWM